jgi:hypothetical protein
MDDAEDLTGTSWCYEENPLRIGGRTEVRQRRLTFVDTERCQIEQGLEVDDMPDSPGGRRTRVTELSVNGCWKQEGGQAWLSGDGQTWTVVERLGPGRIRVAELEYGRCPPAELGALS